MTARRNLRLLGSMSGPVSEERIDEVLDIVGLRERADSKVGGYSHGMKQRLGIAQALLHQPELIILDEPTSGLDPQGMKDVRELVRELGRGGTTVFLSSHLLHEVEQVCNRAVIINKGRVVVQGPVCELRPKGTAVKVLTGDQRKAGETLRGAVRRRQRDGGRGVPAGRRPPTRPCPRWCAGSSPTASTCTPSCRRPSRASRTSSSSSRSRATSAPARPPASGACSAYPAGRRR